MFGGEDGIGSDKTAAMFLLVPLMVAAGDAPGPCPDQGHDFRIDQCCGGALFACLQDTPHCDIAVRMEEFRQWLLEIGRPCSTIDADLDARYRSLHDTTRHTIDTAGVEISGPGNAAVEVMMYVSMSCPLCERLFREIHDSLQTPGRSGRARFFVKPFSATRADNALAAAVRWKQQTQLLRILAPIKERLTPDMIVGIVADSLGIPRSDFLKAVDDRKTAGFVARSRGEAVRNGVEVTPTFFINGRRYRSFKDARWVLDAVDYELGTRPLVAPK